MCGKRLKLLEAGMCLNGAALILHLSVLLTRPHCRYSPNFSKRCTHLIVAAEQSDTSQVKVYLAGVNKEKWQAHAVRLDWLLDCTQNSCQIPEDPYKVEPPSPEVGAIACLVLVSGSIRRQSAVLACAEVSGATAKVTASCCTDCEQSS